jgi:HAD superfamily hydrolase (TIGR01549 family)
MIKAVFFDVANTLLEKPDLFPRMSAALLAHDYAVDAPALRHAHKFLSEAFAFPDKTSREFYAEFNQNLLYSLGIAPSDQLLREIFEACTYLPWKPFPDTAALSGISVPMGILSNWDSSLREKLDEHFSVNFKWTLCSQDEGVRKPHPIFFRRMMEVSNLQPDEILFIGDSMKLDIHPALQVGVRGVLIDRMNHFPHAGVPRIKNLKEVKKWL